MEEHGDDVEPPKVEMVDEDREGLEEGLGADMYCP